MVARLDETDDLLGAPLQELIIPEKSEDDLLLGAPLSVVEAANEDLMFKNPENTNPALDRVPPGSFMDALEAIGNFEMGSEDPLFEASKNKAKEIGSRLRDFSVTSGQLARTGLSLLDQANPLQIPGLPTSTQAYDVAGEAVSSPFELAGSIYSDLTRTEEGNNLLFQMGRTIREGSRTPDSELAQEDLSDLFGRGIAQTATYYVIGAGLKALEFGTKAVGAIAAGLGAAIGGQAGREDAIRHGADSWQTDVAQYLDAAVGLTQGIPVGLAFSRLDEITGGVFSKKFKSEAGQLAASGVLGLLQEGLQELGQTYGENYTAAELAAYDPTRSLSENIVEAAGIGGGVGLLTNLLATYLGIGKRNRAIADINKEIEERVLKPLGIKSIEDIVEGGFTPLSEAYLNVLSGEQKVKDTYDRLARTDPDLAEKFYSTVEGVEASEQLSLPRISTGTYEVNTIEELQAAAQEAGYPEAMLKLLLNEEIDGTATVAERLAESDQAVSFTKMKDFYTSLLASTEQRLAENPNSKEAPHWKMSIEIYKDVIATEKELAKHLRTLGEILLPMLPKGEKILLADNTFSLTPEAREADGYIVMFKIGEQNVNAISVRLDNLAEAISYDVISRSENLPHAGLAKKNAITDILNIYAHEFGHVLAFHQFQSLLHKIQNGTATDREEKIWRGLEADYQQYIVDKLNSTKADVFLTSSTPSRLLNDLQALGLPLYTKLSSVVEKASNLKDFSRKAVHTDSLSPTEQWRHQYDVNYIFSMKEYFAEEFAKIALGQEDLINADALPFFKEHLEDIRKVINDAPGRFFKPTTATMENYAKEHSLKGARQKAIEDMQKNVVSDPMVALFNAGLLDHETAKQLSGEQDSFNKFMDIALNIYQIGEKNPNLKGFHSYIAHLEEWHNEVNRNLALAQDRLTEWRNLSNTEAELLGRLLTDETVGKLPDGGWLERPRFFTPEEIATYKLSDAALELRKHIHEDLRRILDEMEAILIAMKRQIFTSNPIEQTREVAKVKKEFAELRAKPFFPLMRFGDYTMQLFAKGDQIIDGRPYKDGAMVDWQTFDTKRERDREVNAHLSSGLADKTTVSSSKIVQPNFSLQGMPLTMLEHLESQLSSVQLDPKVREAIQKVKNDVLPFKSFRKQFQRRKRIRGYSIDAQRAYANYMTSAANHLARVKYDRLFKDDFDSISDSIKVINRLQKGDSTKRAMILNHMNEHLKYVMNPVNEFVGLRAFAFHWYLGFLVKSATVNLLQIPFSTYPYLAMRHGDPRAVAQITKAYKTAFDVATNPDKVDPDILKLIEQGMHEGWLDQSLATELALAASEKNLDKSLPRHAWQQAMAKLSEYGSLPFHLAEKLNRHVTAIATYKLNRAGGMEHKQAVRKAKIATKETQYEYARYARAKFMRGPLGGTAFVFMSFMQNMIYASLRGDTAAMRMLLMFLLIGGVLGVPFAENLIDILDAAMTKLKRELKSEDPYTDIRTDLREMLKEMEVNPDLILHGTSASTFGFGNLGEAMGWPIPSIDLSGSVSMGRVIPGTELLRPGRADTFEKAAVGGFERGGGAIASGLVEAGRSIFDQSPDQWKRAEGLMPAWLRAVSKAARYTVRGEEATRSGYPIAGFDMHDPQDQAEIIAQSMGYTPRDVSKGWESYMAQQQAVIYYETWKTGLLRQWNYAQENHDQEAVKLANADIAAYNKAVPYGEMRIGTETRIKSYESYLKTRQYNAARIEQNKAFRRMKSDIQEIYESGDNPDTEK